MSDDGTRFHMRFLRVDLIFLHDLGYHLDRIDSIPKFYHFAQTHPQVVESLNALELLKIMVTFSLAL